jgi:hypothetical protein
MSNKGKARGSSRHTVRKSSAVFRILAPLGLGFDDLAAMTGLNVRTLHNVASGSSKSRRARRKIEAALGVTVWPPIQEVAATETGREGADQSQP